MAIKGQKYNKYTSEFITKIIEEIKQKDRIKKIRVLEKTRKLNKNNKPF